MCFTIDQIERACGLLLLNEFKTFVYCCKRCRREFDLGPDLEVHILSEHEDDERGFPTKSELNVEVSIQSKQQASRRHIENVFLNDDAFTGDFDQNSCDRSFGSYEASCDAIGAVSIELEPIDIKPDVFEPWNKLEKCERLSQGKPVQEIATTAEVEKRGKRQNGGGKEEENDAQPDTAGDDCVVADFGAESDNESDDPTDSFLPTKKRTYSRGGPNSKLFHCDMCPNYKTKTKGNLKMHIKRHIENRVRKPCPICKKSPRNYDNHMKMNHTEKHPYKCDYENCKKQFKSRCNLLIHARVHTGETPFLCSQCGKAFTSKTSLYKHNQRLHSDKLPHACKECGRTFITPAVLQDHIHSFHSGARPHVCDVCGKSYATKKYLRTHKQFHGEKRWQCRHCENKFFTHETRRFHEKTIHNVV